MTTQDQLKMLSADISKDVTTPEKFLKEGRDLFWDYFDRGFIAAENFVKESRRA